MIDLIDMTALFYTMYELGDQEDASAADFYNKVVSTARMFEDLELARDINN